MNLQKTNPLLSQIQLASLVDFDCHLAILKPIELYDLYMVHFEWHQIEDLFLFDLLHKLQFVSHTFQHELIH